MKKILLALAAITLLLASCTQYVFVPVPNPSDDNTSGITTEDRSAAAITSFLQSEEYWTIVKDGGTTGIHVNESEPSGASAKSMATPRAAQTGKTTVRFENYMNTVRGIFIESGKLEYDFVADDATTELIASSYSVNTADALRYTYQGETHNFNISVTEAPMKDVKVSIASGVVTFEDVPSITIPSNADISVDNSTVDIEDIGAVITDGFGGGSGTPEDPYRIYNADQFTYIADLAREMATDIDNYYYFTVYDDLDFYSGMRSPLIPIFRGEIDFQEHAITGLTVSILENMSAEQRELNSSSSWAGNGEFCASLIGDYIGGAIKNLEFYPEEYLSIAAYSNWTSKTATNIDKDPNAQLVFDNVNVYGTFRNLGTNASLYVSQVFNADLIMENCENHANMEYLTYGAPFLGGYLDGTSSATFRNCANYGDITGNWAAVFIGNRTIFARTTIEKVSVENCHNYGTVTGFEWVGFYAPVNNGEYQNDEYLDGYSWFDKTSMSTNSWNDSNVIFKGDEEPVDIEVTVNEEGKFVIENSNPDYAYVRLAGTAYSTMIANGVYNGTFLIMIGTPDSSNPNIIKVQSDGTTLTTDFRKIGIIDSTHPDAATAVSSQDTYGNKIITVNGVDYYYNNSDTGSEVSHIIGYNGDKTDKLSFYLYCYDSDKRMIATKKLTDI